MKIINVSQYASPHMGGAERYIHEVTSRLENKGMEVHFLCAQGREDQKVSLPWFCFSGGFHPLWIKQVDEILRETNPDVIFAHFTVPGITDVVVRRAHKQRIPVCLVYHSDVTGPQWYKKLLGNVYYHMAGRKTLKLADRIIASAPEYHNSSPWLAGINNQFDYIMPGVEALIFRGVNKGCKPNLLFVGKPDDRGKGFDVLYNAWLKLDKIFPELELVVVGDCSNTYKYPLAVFMGRINSRQELADLYASASITILPSTSPESFGMVLAESLVAGTPVVGSDIGGISAIVEDGVNGYLARPGDDDSLAKAISKALGTEEELRKNIRSAHQEYIKRYDWDQIAEQVEAVLVKCTEEGRSVLRSAFSVPRSGLSEKEGEE